MEKLKIAASRANLNPKQKEQVDGLSKLLDTHKSLLDMPQNLAEQRFNSLPQDQRESLATFMGTQDDTEPSRGWLGTAAHYVGAGVKGAVGGVFKGLIEASDFMTRLYRTGALAAEQGYFTPSLTKSSKDKINILTDAWTKANDKGELLYNENRINKANQKFGATRVKLAQQVSEGKPLDDIIATGTPEEKEIAALAAKNQDPLWQDAYDAVAASKYSPGRQYANLLLPEGLEGSGFLYKGVSGIVDAGYRIFADPTLALGKAKKAYDVANYGLFKIVGNGKKVDEVFQNPNVVKFFNQYGSQLENLSTARKAKDLKKATEISANLKRLAPEFGPAAVDEFIKAGVKDSATAKNYLSNFSDIKNILAGQAARKVPLIPRLDASRRARVAFFTGANKVFNIDEVGQRVVQALYGTAPQYEDIITGLTSNVEQIAGFEKQVGRFKGKDGAFRMPLSQIQGRIDRFSRKFTTIPYFSNGYFDVNSADAVNKVYQVARLANSRYHSKIIAEAFAAGNEGQRKQIFTGLWNTVAEIRGVSKTTAGKTYMQEFAGKGLEKKYAPDLVINGQRAGNPAEFAGEQVALFPYQLSSAMSVPSIVDLDRLSARSGLINRIIGVSHNKWFDKLTSGWVIGTLAGPRFPIRNATEDLMMHLAIGDSPWGIVKGRLFSTRGRIAKGISGTDTAIEKLKKTVLLDTEAGELGAINKFLRKDELAEFSAKIKEAESVEDVRKVMGEAFLRSSLAQKLDPTGAAYLDEIARYGNLDDTLRAVSEGGKNALRGADQYLQVTDDVSRFGKMGAIEIDGVAYKQATGDKAFTQFNPLASQQAKVSWLIQLGIASNDELGKIAVKYLDDEAKAISKISEYLRALPTAERERFQLYFLGGDETIHAQRAYAAIRTLFSKRNGDVNEKLLAKVRQGVGDAATVSTKSLKIDDLPFEPALTPEWISGPTLVPVSEGGNFTASLFDKGWDAMGEANARFSREPIVLNEMIRIRKDLEEAGLVKRVMDQFTKGKTGDDLIKAETAAKTHIVSMVEDLAKARVLAFVDNPAVRSQLAMSARNFARFYRATEDFYRRLYRAVRYNPESITRAALTYEGIAHSGFVQTDDNGEEYFFYPGLTPVYQAMNNALITLGVDDAFQAPMPVEFSAKLKMITPSMNPDSLFPTFSGPLAAVPLKMVFNAVPQLDGLERALLGVYSEDQPMVNALLPAHFNRFLATLNRDERNSQYASAFRKAVTYLEAAGYGLKPVWDEQQQQWIQPSPGERQDYKDKIEASTLTVLATRFLFGFLAPASPQITLKSDIAQWVRDNERVNFKQVFSNLVQKYDSYDKAVEEWIRLFPKEMPYTISESESTVVAIMQANDKAVGWIDKNQGLLKKYPEAGAFLIPSEGDFSFDAYKLLIRSGLKQSKTLDDFLRQSQTARDEQFYYDQVDAYEAQLSATYNDAAKRQLREQWGRWKQQFLGSRPMLQEELGKGAERAIQRTKALNDLSNMLADTSVKTQPQVRSTLKQMLDTYNNYINARDAVYGSNETALNYKDLLKQNTKLELERLSKTNRNAENAYFALFSKLIRD